MADPTLAASLPLTGVSLPDQVELVREVRSWGYQALWGSEVAGPDAFTLLGAAAVVTDLELGVAVVPVQTRSAFVLAMTAASLQELSGGRFTLGLGASSETIVERFGGGEFRKPLTNVREMVEALRPALRGERTSHEGEFVRISGYKPPVTLPKPVPLYLGSLNTASLRMAGELGDGLCLNQMAPSHVPDLLAEVRTGAEDAGRDLDENFGVMARLFCLVTDDPESAKSMVPWIFSPYVVNSGYARFYRWMGFEDEVEQILAAAEQNDKAAMAEAYSGRIVDELFCIGTADEVVDRIRQYCDAGVTIPAVQPLSADLASARNTLEAVGRAWS